MEGQPEDYWKNWSDKNMEALANKETVTSHELLEQINIFRKQEGKSKLEHYDLKKIIRKELTKDFNAGKISCIKQKDSRGREQEIYILTFSQGKRVLLRESPTVRQAVIEYTTTKAENKRGPIFR